MCYSNEFLIQVLGFLFVCLLFLKGGVFVGYFFWGGGWGGWAVNMNSSMNKIKSSPY